MPRNKKFVAYDIKKYQFKDISNDAINNSRTDDSVHFILGRSHPTYDMGALLMLQLNTCYKSTFIQT